MFGGPWVEQTEKAFAVPRVGFKLPVKTLQSYEIALGDPEALKKGEMLKITILWFQGYIVL
jgi:hypothetical protein